MNEPEELRTTYLKKAEKIKRQSNQCFSFGLVILIIGLFLGFTFNNFYVSFMAWIFAFMYIIAGYFAHRKWKEVITNVS